MKRKLIIPIVLCLFAGLTVFNIGLANRPASTDTTLDLISVMVKAFDEGETNPRCQPPWDPPLTDDEFFECFGCRATIVQSECKGKDGTTYTYAYKPDPS